MAFCEKERPPLNNGFTSVDNKFFTNYMPDAPDMRSAVYLLGFTLTQTDGEQNSCLAISQKLGISEQDVMDAYLYWEELGLVRVETDPPHVVYLDVRDSYSSLKKIKPGKYAKFSQDIQQVITGRMITVTEYNEYYNFLENTGFDASALVAVAKYCAELKGGSINYRYILTVAQNLQKYGAYTLAEVSERLNSQLKYDDDLRLVFKAMSSNRKIDHADRENYELWTKTYGFTQDVIVAVAKNCKSGGMYKLNSLLGEYYRRGAMSVKEIEQYETEKTHLYNLAREINKIIGVIYQNVDSVVEEYIVVWLQRGYDDETLLAIAKYCFRTGIRTLNGMAYKIDKLYKAGVTTMSALDEYLSRLAQLDQAIQSVLERCGLDRRPTQSDRTLYKTWTEYWNMPSELIMYAAQLAAGTSSPLAYINRVLSDCKQNGIYTAAAAEQRRQTNAHGNATTATTAYIGGKDIERRTYTDEQLNALFTALDTED